jgi:periplasmic protein TonB
MNADGQLHWREDFDEPWRRLPWIVPAALMFWLMLLGGFTQLLEQKSAPAPPPEMIEARIVELPPTAGLQGGGAPAGAPAIAHPAPVVRPKPEVKPKPPPPIHHVKKVRVKPHPVFVEPPSPFGTAKHVETPEPETPPIASKGPSTGEASEHRSGSAVGGSGGGGVGIGAGTGSGSGAGIGSDSAGARAMYAPTPEIPDDLRENTFSTMAVARFKVSYDGNVEVTLVKPTSNPRLNQILLDTLKQWKFVPAMKDGIAINSDFEVRIPITVQ